MKNYPILLAAGALALSAPAYAQDVSASPTYGETTLASGFTPDPFRQAIQSGGPIDASGISAACAGFIASAPDYSINYTAGSLPLYLSATADNDITLVVNGPDGSWYCDDDSGGNLNPLITFQVPQSGRYDIWVGTYGGATNYPATVNVSELYGPAENLNASRVSRTVTSAPPPTTRSRGPNFALSPTYETLNLRAGFTGDPRTVSLLSGGSNDASSVDGACRGYVADAPDVRVNYEAGGTFPLILSVESSADTTLVVNGPDGRWYCDDDGGNGFNPSLRWDSPMSGQYDVWVGTYGSATTESAELYVSELSSR
ncbi:hypothetical protein [Aurantiacibacter gangjinensis]|uniref:Uncharacterized protein n=1 Tax=Aurantiacibacter gangjinensis TaxID=502682 RepID=A0A0G9MQ95_9SPHN|nr:hypothetical protein [Aurantiacibacter gangjinensis]APE28751.1 hypothetical protein BMF35_a1922 [Aurantiacibacter gangjinensis]KLE32906.1 hypothetical protein AAW01_02505 [Aurantiacibacter gangjinensis]